MKFLKRRRERKERERLAHDEGVSRMIWGLCNLSTGRNTPYPDALSHFYGSTSKEET